MERTEAWQARSGCFSLYYWEQEWHIQENYSFQLHVRKTVSFGRSGLPACLPVPQYKSHNPKGILNQKVEHTHYLIGLLLTVTDVSTTCALVIVRVKVSCFPSVDGTNLWLLTSASVRHVLGRLSVKPWCDWLWRFVMPLVRFDRSIVTVKQSFIVSQILGCPVILSLFGLLESVNTVKSFVRCR